MRLIDADELEEELVSHKFKHSPYLHFFDVAISIERMPTIDAEPVRHGHWRLVSRLDEVEWLYGAVIECSQCKHEEVANYKYCPNCGAKMDEVEDAE